MRSHAAALLLSKLTRVPRPHQYGELPSDAKINETDTFGGEEGDGEIEFEEDSGDSDEDLDDL